LRAREERTPESRSEHILIVDDEPWITEVIADQLSNEGFQTETTNHSSEVMDRLEATPHDLVILDIYMPEVDGLTLLKQIQQRHPFLGVLMLTGVSDADTAVMAMHSGAADYIVKPFHPPQLSMRVERALERSRLLLERAHSRELLEQRVEEQTRKLQRQSKQLSQMLDRLFVTYRATLKALEATLDVRDHSAPGHCRRVSKLAVQLASRMGFQGNDLVVIEYGALLHDIGKLGIEDSILMKPGPLTEEEWGTMRKHPEIGCQIVGHIDFLQDALPIIRYHHERYDGTGYPDGLKGEEIPILARIFSVADAYDALTSQRPYNAVNNSRQALEALRAGKGTHFDPHVVDAFADMIEEQIALLKSDEHHGSGTQA
jgi:putative two-component system response regulator